MEIPLCLQNQGKYLSKSFEELRVEAYNNLSALGTIEQDFAETSNLPITSINAPGQWEIMTQPMPYYNSDGGKLIDARPLRDPTADTSTIR